MREIRFRAWDLEESRFVQDFDDHEDECWIDDVTRVNSLLSCKRYIWEQYTGLNDKNGVEIYENDIIRKPIWTSSGPKGKSKYYNFTIEFDDGCFVKKYRDDRSSRYGVTFGGYMDAEVIGNIHENGDLLND